MIDDSFAPAPPSHARNPAPTRRRLSFALPASLLLATGVLSGGPAVAADPFPVRPITVLVPFAPGGPTDIFARTLASGLQKALGQPVAVENRTGAGGNIATTALLAAKPDGYTLMVGASYLTVSPYLYKSATYDPVRDFTPIGAPVESHLVLVTRPGGPSLSELIATAKSTNVPIKLASPGAGTLSHLGGVAIGQATGAPMTHVAYRGVSPAITDIMAGHVDMMIDGISSSLPLIKAGKVKPLAVPAPVRDPLLPDVATMAQLGFPNQDVLAWNVLLAPAATPGDVVDRLDAAVRKVLAAPDVRAELQERGLWPTDLTSGAFKARMVEESKHWKSVIAAGGITVD